MDLKITVYSKSACPQCDSAKMLLKSRSLPFEEIRLDEVLKAVNGCAHIGSPPAGAKGCPVSEHIPRQVAKALTAAELAAAGRQAEAVEVGRHAARRAVHGGDAAAREGALREVAEEQDRGALPVEERRARAARRAEGDESRGQ